MSKIITGFSKPYVGLYVNTSGTISYTDGQELSEGVEVSISVESSDAKPFYANNKISEIIPAQFKNGTATLTVKGLNQDSEALIAGVGSADSDGFIKYGNEQSVPFVGLGFIIRSMENSTTYYTPVILRKAVLNPQTLNAATQGEEVEFQTQELEFTLYRDDSTNGDWKWVGGEEADEATAENAIKTALGITSGGQTATASN